MRTVVTLLCLLMPGACRSYPAITIDHSDLARIAGKFSNIRFDDQTKLISGVTLRIFSADDYESILVFGEGTTVSRLVYAETEMGIDWPLGQPIPESEVGRTLLKLKFNQHGYSGTFEGYIFDGFIEGVFRFSSGETNNVKLLLVECDDGTL